jgi:hypothetical protein
MNTKKARLLKYIQTHKRGITGQEALLKIGLYRLSGEIHELRKEGHDIKTEMMEREEKDGSITKYARYYL